MKWTSQNMTLCSKIHRWMFPGRQPGKGHVRLPLLLQTPSSCPSPFWLLLMPPPPAQPACLLVPSFPAAALGCGVGGLMESHSGGGFRVRGSDVQLCVGPLVQLSVAEQQELQRRKLRLRKVVHSHVVVMSWQNWFWFQEPVLLSLDWFPLLLGALSCEFSECQP